MVRFDLRLVSRPLLYRAGFITSDRRGGESAVEDAGSAAQTGTGLPGGVQRGENEATTGGPAGYPGAADRW